MPTYSEIAFPLANSRSIGKLVRFNYLVTNAIDMPLVISPHVNTLGRPYYTRQLLYFLDDVDCVIRWMIPEDDSGQVDDLEQMGEKLRHAANNCLFEYSLRYPVSRLTIASAHAPIYASSRELPISVGEAEYLRTDNTKVELLSPTAHELFEAEFEEFLGRIYTDEVFEDEKGTYLATPEALDCGLEEPAVRFRKIPYTYRELEFLSQLIPADPEAVGMVPRTSGQGRKYDFVREKYIGSFGQSYFQEMQYFPAHKWPDEEIIEVNGNYSQTLLDFYFAGLSSLSPIVEFSNYYRILEYFFEDATYENAKKNLDDRLAQMHKAKDYGEYLEFLKAMNLASSEDKKIREVVNYFVAREQLDTFLRNGATQAARTHFCNYQSDHDDFKITQLKSDDKNICTAVADRIYKFRNAIFHAKRTRGGKPATSFRPNSTEEREVIRHEVELVKMVAQEIIKRTPIDVL